MHMRPMVARGLVFVRAYPRLVLCLYAVQLVVAGLFGWVATRIFATAFAVRPLFDQAVAGDVSALLFVLRDNPHVVASVLWVAAGVVAGWVVLSWVLIGGLNAVVLRRPEREVAAVFGAGGAATFFPYARLALVAAIPYVIIAGVVLVGLGRLVETMILVVTPGEAAVLLATSLAPGAVLFWIQGAAVDYARIDLSRDPDLSSRSALLRGYRVVLTDWRPLVHILVYVAWFVAISAVYVAVAQSDAALVSGAGLAGGIGLFLLRQLTQLLRLAGKIACAAGQVAYRAG